MRIAVYGAAGHTGRFVVAELLRRGQTPVAVGRDETKLSAALAGHGGQVEMRLAGLDSERSLDLALRGADVVINCAGPFLDTAVPLIEAALRGGLHYFDVTAEQQSAAATLERFDAPARERGLAIVPAAGFYGGLGDLVATAAMSDWTQADRIEIAIALDHWWPTQGTRRTGARNTAARLVVEGGKLTEMRPSEPRPWPFPEPFGAQDVVEVPLSETILIARHLAGREVRNYLNETPLRDLLNPATPAPVATSDDGRSDQHFIIDVRAWNGDDERRVTAGGRDIYAVTAPIVVEAVEHICETPLTRGGAFALGEVVDASAFLHRLAKIGSIELLPNRTLSAAGRNV
jgi:hypothetical protein